MDKLEGLRQRKKELLKQICKLKDMRKGSVTEQYYELEQEDGTKRRQGPYFLYSYKEQGQSKSARIPPSVAHRYQDQIGQFRDFERLCSELVKVSHEIGDITISDEYDDVDERQKKQRRRLKKKSVVKSRG